MKNNSPLNLSAFRAQRAFTLIEMLVVIAIIALLAGLVIPLSGIVNKKKILARARIEIDNLDLAINTYKNKKGHYPPDNTATPAGAFTNQLFYELWGAVLRTPSDPANLVFTNTFNGSETIDGTTLKNFFNSGGIINSSSDPNEVINFVKTLKAGQIQNINTAANPVWVFALTSTGPVSGLPVPPGGPAPNPPAVPVNVIRYVSSGATNNPTTFDLWVDVIIGGQTNRVSNWNKESEIVH